MYTTMGDGTYTSVLVVNDDGALLPERQAMWVPPPSIPSRPCRTKMPPVHPTEVQRLAHIQQRLATERLRASKVGT